MTPEKELRHEGRVDYRWRADRERGFEKATLIYDRQGKLIAVDYQTTREQQPAERSTERTDQ